MTGIEVDTASRTTFALNEPLVLIIRAVYSDGSTSLVSLDMITSNYDAGTLGQQNITITYTGTGFTALWTVTVLQPAAKIGENGYFTLSAAITGAADGDVDSPTEIIILKDITTGSQTEAAGFTIPEGKHIKLTVE